MAHPLMPKATAVWLVENTTLTFLQIAKFCDLHEMEVQAIADGEVATGMHGLDPIAGGELTQEEIDRCAADPKVHLKMAPPNVPMPKARQKGARYTPVSKRQDRPDAIAWLLRNHPELTDAQISRLIGTTKPTINAIRDRSHWNMPNIKPQNPIALGLCSSLDLEKVVTKARKKAEKAEGYTPPKPVEAPVAEAGAEAEDDRDPVTKALARIAALAPGEIILVKGLPKPVREPDPEVFEDTPMPAPAVLGEGASTPDILKAAEDVFSSKPGKKEESSGDAASPDKG